MARGGGSLTGGLGGQKSSSTHLQVDLPLITSATALVPNKATLEVPEVRPVYRFCGTHFNPARLQERNF